MVVETRCVHCKAQNFIKKGLRQTKLRGAIQKFKCKECGKFFTNDEGFYRMRNNEKIITMSIDMYYSNLSSRKMRNQLRRHMSTKTSHVSILDWARRYALKVHKYVETLQYEVGETFYADETYIPCEGRKEDRFWASVDWHTRLITGIHYSLSGNPEEAQEFLKKAISKGMPKSIQTDAAMFYPRAFRKMFYSTRKRGLTVQHKIQNYHKTKIHNYKIETVFMKIKDRVYDFRGLKALWSAPILLAGITIQHNFIEQHTTTKIVPCEAAGLKEELGDNRWLGLIKASALATGHTPG